MTCATCGLKFTPHSRRSRVQGHEIVWISYTADGPGPYPWRLLHLPA